MTNYITFITLLLLALTACEAQTTHKMTNETTKNPLLCDPGTGICEIPGVSDVSQQGNIKAVQKPVHIVYFTDPICSSCWGIEPQLRKLKLEYGDYFDIEYRMGGLLPDWSYNSGGISKPSDVAHHWDEVSVYYDMPIDGDVWLEDPLPSSYPPSIAFKAAQLQDNAKAIRFLRAIREMVFLEKKNITKWEHLEKAAIKTGLDPVKLKEDFEGRGKAAFQADLDLARAMGVRGFPTMLFSDQSDEKQLKVYGFKPYEAFENAVLELFPAARKTPVDTGFEALFAHYPTLTTKEYSTLTGTSKVQADEQLQQYYTQKKLTKTVTKNGALWKKETSK